MNRAISYVVWRLRKMGLMLLPLYTLLVVAVLGLQGNGWRSAEGFRSTLGSVKWIPFYYHARVPLSDALLSVIAQGVVYAPIGVVLALLGSGRSLGGLRPVPASALGGLVLALAVETLRLWRAGLGADPTNLWIAAGAAALACHLTLWVLVSWGLASRHRTSTGHGVASARVDTPMAPLHPLGLSGYGRLVQTVLGVDVLARTAGDSDGYAFSYQGRQVVGYYGEVERSGRTLSAVYKAELARAFDGCAREPDEVEPRSLQINGRLCAVGSGACNLPSGESMYLSLAVLDMGEVAAVHVGSGYPDQSRVIDLTVRALVEYQSLG
jgi:hypothetical protein